ncbi:MAG: phosphopantothenoylcysteine decarboxylase [Candidatus Omnitrophica bacterium]|nr:phosphopantothenoylcysteine decarboxylase [Candidatus Omnitrophota bacterium]
MSAGPTREPLDPVRFISNYSTGYMGAQLAAEALARGHRVTVVCGPLSEPLPATAHVVRVEQAEEMERALRRRAKRADVVIMAAAVSDFRPTRWAIRKLPRRNRLRLELTATPDIISRLPRHPRQVVVGFALETGRVAARAQQKLRAKRLDLLLAQHANGGGAPFGRRPVRAWLLSRDGTVTRLGSISKSRASSVLLDKIEVLCYGQHRRAASSQQPAVSDDPYLLLAASC